MKKPRSILKCFVSIGALVVIAIFAILAFKQRLRSYYLHFEARPVIGSDFEDVKILYVDLFSQNSRSYNIAGSPRFPINTDTLMMADPRNLNSFSEKLRLESLIASAYQPRPSEDVSEVTMSVKTNSWYRMLPFKKKIQSIVLRPIGSQDVGPVSLALNKEPTVANDDADNLHKSVRLFAEFIRLRKNGVSPKGTDFDIPYGEFVQRYGYGQCENQSYALGDLFAANGIRPRLVKIAEPSHTMVEAEIKANQWALFDPQLEINYVDSANGTFEDFDAVRRDLDNALRRHAGANNETVRAYYSGGPVAIEPLDGKFRDYPPLTWDLLSGESLEYDFTTSTPWLTARNITPPPEGTIGFVRHTFGLGTSFDISSRFEINSALLRFSTPGTGAIVNDEQVDYDPNWPYARLDRYVWGKNELRLRASKPVELTLSSQFSILPFYQYSDGTLRINANGQFPLEVTIRYLNSGGITAGKD